MSGFTPDEKLRLEQLRALRRQWLKDQELSPREPVLPRQKTLSGFWENFLQTDSIWRRFTRPYGIVEKKPKIFPGDKILETGEVIPPMKVCDIHDYH
uniref:NADH dehydrogenase [ubiquinone] 1 beta subcomplex subunit 6 n=1 Tax=Vombatus ursinus TaxID=29139 RepID=A0A4X2KFD4_VOMUR